MFRTQSMAPPDPAIAANLPRLAAENPNAPNVNQPMNALSASQNPTYYRAGSVNQFLTPMIKPGKTDIVWNGLEQFDALAAPALSYTHNQNVLWPMTGYPVPPQLEPNYPSPFVSREPAPLFQRDAWYERPMQIVSA